MKKARLLKLAQHLESGKLGHAKFDFGWFNHGYEGPTSCGTNGCAIGECPILWPKYWRFQSGFVTLRDGGSDGTIAAATFFGIDYLEANHLFMPSTSDCLEQDPKRYGGRRLGIRATRQQVAANIRAFVEKCG